MRRTRFVTAVCIAAAVLATPVYAGQSAVLGVSAVILSNANCLFQTATSNMAFGNIDPTSTGAVFQTVSYRFRCTGPASVPVTVALSDDSGLHESGPGAYRMQHATNPSAFIPYSLTYPSALTVARNVVHTISVTGTLLPVNFSSAAMGNYADTVTLTIVP